MGEFRVEFDRPLTVKKTVRGLDVTQHTGMCYVDCFFPDGTQGTVGYIGVNPLPGSTFAPLVHCTQEVADLTQAEINRQLGCAGDDAPTVTITYVGNDFEDDEDDEDDADDIDTNEGAGVDDE